MSYYECRQNMMSLSAKAAITNCHQLNGLNDRCLYLTVLEAGKYKIKALADSVSGEGPLPGLRKATFLLYCCGHLSHVSSYKATTIHQVST